MENFLEHDVVEIWTPEIRSNIWATSAHVALASSGEIVEVLSTAQMVREIKTEVKDPPGENIPYIGLGNQRVVSED